MTRWSQRAQRTVRSGVVKIFASEAAGEFIRERGGTVWVWLDPHTWLGGTVYTYLQCAMEHPGASKATRRWRSARRAHTFHPYEHEGYTIQFEYGIFGEPEELHLEVKRWPKRRVEAYWNGAVFVGDDIPPMGER
jgi:hypothetical protein